MTKPREDMAVGATEDGTVVFYDLAAAQTGIRRLMSERRREPLGKSVPPIVLIDELAALPSAALRENTQRLLAAGRQRTFAGDGFDYMPSFGWNCRTCNTVVTEPTCDPDTGRRYCQICALGTA